MEGVMRLVLGIVLVGVGLSLILGCGTESRYECVVEPDVPVRDSVLIADVDYVRNKYFFVIDPYTFISGKELSDIEVYLDDGDGTNNGDAGPVGAYAFVEPNDRPPETLWDSLGYFGYFDMLEVNVDYVVDLRTGEITLRKALSWPHVLAIIYVYDGVRTGGTDDEDRLILKMLRPSDTYLIERAEVWKEPTLKLMRKNIYSLGASYISEDRVRVRIFRRASPVDQELQGEHQYAKILGIDLRDENGVPASVENGWKTDGYADGGRLKGEAGLLLFPDLRPFDPLITPEDRPAALENTNAIIYDEHRSTLKRSEHSKYYMIIHYSTVETL
jgi:hypothetical protein